MKIIECPRDAMQGITTWIPTEKKIKYLNSLLQVGFDTLDFGSFVSPKAIPQLADTEAVLASLDLSTTTKLLAIVANVKGAEKAVGFDAISYLGYPFSISETFQQRNTNAGIQDSLLTLSHIQNLCIQHHKKLVVYISMAFGNPYGDTWNAEIALKWVEKIAAMGIEIIAMSDTVGLASAENISYIFSQLIKEIKNVEFGAHLHANPFSWRDKVEAAYQCGIRRFDTAIKGLGGCPMAGDELTGNLATEYLLQFMQDKGLKINIDQKAFEKSALLADSTFPSEIVH